MTSRCTNSGKWRKSFNSTLVEAYDAAELERAVSSARR
jgi:hypothetical protein